MVKKVLIGQKMNRINSCLTLGLFVLLFSCGNKTEKPKEINKSNNSEVVAPKVVSVPEFNADSAYSFIKKQVDFGPRIPGTPAHNKTAKWLASKFAQYADSVSVQDATVKTWDNKTFTGKNIQAFFQPEKPRRVLLSAHWDTRPFSDEDTHSPNKAFDGADDGGSGVGVLLEIARVLSVSAKTDIGVDIVLFDVEDWGNPKLDDTYCLGSQYWARNFSAKHKPYFGVNLDMVGAANARFTREGFSMQYAAPFVSKVWNSAAKLGYNYYFIFEDVNGVVDDHYYVSKFAGIPSIDIINYNRYNGSRGGFGQHWHTQKDNMSIIDKATLFAVGSVVLDVIYYE